MATGSATNGNGNGKGATAAPPANGSKNGLQTSYVLITVHPGYELKIVEALRTIPEVLEINPLFGEYDIVAKLEFSHFAVLNSIVLKKIRPLPGIRDTKTMLTTSFDPSGKKQAPPG